MICTTPDCNRPEFSKGLCSTCYGRKRRTGSVAPRERKPKPSAPPAVCVCPNAALEVHRIGCPGKPPPLPESDSPVLVMLLDELQPELRPEESLRALVQRLKREAERGREANYQPGGRDHDE